MASRCAREGGPRKRKALPKLKDHRVEKVAGAVEMAIARGPDAAANVRRAVEAVGGMGRFVKRGEKVVIKPNIGWNRLPEQAANTNPDVVAEVVRLVVAAGAAKVWVTDVSVNTAEQCFARSGIEKAARAAGATVVRPDTTAFREVDVAGKKLQVADILFPFVEADRVINVPLVKQHGLSLRHHGDEELVRRAGRAAGEAAPGHPPVDRRPGEHGQADAHRPGRHAHPAGQRPDRRQPGRRQAPGHRRGRHRRGGARCLRRRASSA